MERLTKREKFKLDNNEEMVLCNYDDSNCNDSCMYVRPCDWMKKAKQKLWDFENAEEQGLLLRLPLKMGDEAWAIRNYKGITYAQKGFVNEMFFSKDMRLVIVVKNIARGEFGKTVFLTRKEAEQALKQIELKN